MLAREVSVLAGSDQNLRQFHQRSHVNARRTDCHLCARDGIEHPVGHEQKNVVRILDLYELTVRSSRYVVNSNLASETRMPRIMDFQLLSDMGRMNGRSPHTARSPAGFALNGALTCLPISGRSWELQHDTASTLIRLSALYYAVSPSYRGVEQIRHRYKYRSDHAVVKVDSKRPKALGTCPYGDSVQWC